MCVIKANDCPAVITSDTGYEIKIWENEDDYVKANWLTPTTTPTFTTHIHEINIDKINYNFWAVLGQEFNAWHFAARASGSFKITTAGNYDI